jgi:putative transposase
MKFECGDVYHIFNQGNNRETLFNNHDDYCKFIQLSKEYVIPYCDMLAWCLLPNHFHFMVHANQNSTIPHKQGGLVLDKLTNGYRSLLSAYSHDYNKRNDRSGALFRPKTKAKNISTPLLKLTGVDYPLNCFYYVHQNPRRHKLVKDLSLWPYSSFLFYANKREKDFCDKNLAATLCEYHPDTFLHLACNRIPDECLSLFESS